MQLCVVEFKPSAISKSPKLQPKIIKQQEVLWTE